jgi:hypothetical protein
MIKINRMIILYKIINNKKLKDNYKNNIVYNLLNYV